MPVVVIILVCIGGIALIDIADGDQNWHGTSCPYQFDHLPQVPLIVGKGNDFNVLTGLDVIIHAEIDQHNVGIMLQYIRLMRFNPLAVVSPTPALIIPEVEPFHQNPLSSASHFKRPVVERETVAEGRHLSVLLRLPLALLLPCAHC